MPRTLFLSLVFVLFINSNGFAGIEVTETLKYQQQNSTIVTYNGELQLPVKGYWKIVDQETPPQIREIYLRRDTQKFRNKYPDYFKSKIVLLQERERKIKTGSSILRSFYSPLQRYAVLHDFVGPASFNDLDPVKDKRTIELNKKTWTKRFNEQLTGDFAFLIPGVTFNPEKKSGRQLSSSKRKKLLIELRPYVEDGKHWVLYNDGFIAREKIDQELIQQYSLQVLPITLKDQPTTKPPEFQDYILVMSLSQDESGPVSFKVKNSSTKEVKLIQWDLSQAQTDKSTVIKNHTTARRGHWRSYASSASTPVLSSWFEHYGGNKGIASRGNGRRNQGAGLTTFNILGGRAAVEETLQMQNIGRPSQKKEERNIPIESLTGVEVQSHPFSEMLLEQGGDGQKLPLAELAPYDHFFVHVAKPETLLSFLEDGAAFISRFGGVINSNNLQYDLTAKYLARLGLDNKWLRRFLESGEVEEMALVFPDLFFIDGTEITTISRLAHPKPVKLLLQLIGVTGLSQGNIVEHALDNGKTVFWSLLNNLLVCSSSRSEIDRVLALHLANGQGSLGKSDEFRYMLTQLSPEKETRIFAYISDPFIRHLVGPATKISQMRRVIARSEMESLASRILLAKMDGIINHDSPETLLARGYVPENMGMDDFSIDQDLKVHSTEYGTLLQMHSLTTIPVTYVTKSEADSYKRYLDNYNRYWSRYFDPISIRINESKDGSLEMTTFILPLIDNSIYNNLREILVNKEDGEALQVPQPSIKPVIMLSLNLRDKGWMGVSGNSSRFINPGLLDDLGPSVHLAIHDSDPVIASGSGDILGAFNSSFASRGMGGMTMFIPVALSVLTRPCTLFIETKDPEKTMATLKNMTRRFSRQEMVAMDFYKVDGKDEWTMSLNIFGIMKLRYGVEVQGDYLLIRNIPWSNKEKISEKTKVPLKSIFLEASPGACEKQLPGLFTAANEQKRATALKSMAYLYPLLASGYATVDNVEEKHFNLFGFKPVHPDEGKWQWDRKHLTSSSFGSVLSQKQPGYEKTSDKIGLLRNIDNVSLNMQFEDSGLRAILRWKTIGN